MRALGLALAACAVACDRGGGATAPAATTTTTTTTVTSAPVAPDAGDGCSLTTPPARFPAPARLVAIGDLHGDLAAARAALRAAGAIDDRDRWIGGALWVVQLGDILDRGDDEQAIIDLFGALEDQARAAGGRVIVLNGNHELMNAAGDFRYVTPGGMRDFADAPGVDASAPALAQVPEVARARVAALHPGGAYAKRFAQHDAVVVIGDAVFSHAGIVGDWATQLDATNRAARCFLDGQTRTPPPAARSDDGPLWTRVYGVAEPDCAAAKAALATLGLKTMVVAHTVQEHGISRACDDALWRIDVGLAKLYGGPIQVLQVYPKLAVVDGTRL